MVLFPRNDPHLLGGDFALPPTPGDDVVQPPNDGGLATIKIGEGEEKTRIVCGFLGTEKIDQNPVFATLPEMLRLDSNRTRSSEWIRSAFKYAADEIAAGQMGSETILAKISELLFVEAIRRYAENLPDEETGWLSGLRDPVVSKALTLLHSQLEKPWTVEALGREVGLSRSALADRFIRYVGLPPIQYLTQWRMRVAANELRNSNRSLLEVAERVGYDTEAAFSRAFKREMGVPPAKWRKESI